MTQQTATEATTTAAAQDAGRRARMARTSGLPGLPAFPNSTPASLAIRDGVPSIHCWNASLTSAACPDALVTGDAHAAG